MQEVVRVVTYEAVVRCDGGGVGVQAFGCYEDASRNSSFARRYRGLYPYEVWRITNYDDGFVTRQSKMLVCAFK